LGSSTESRFCLSRNLNISRSDAKDLLKNLDSFPGVKKYMTYCSNCSWTGFCSDDVRRRHIFPISISRILQSKFWERTALKHHSRQCCRYHQEALVRVFNRRKEQEWKQNDFRNSWRIDIDCPKVKQNQADIDLKIWNGECCDWAFR
jgi:hypothetical protein